MSIFAPYASTSKQTFDRLPVRAVTWTQAGAGDLILDVPTGYSWRILSAQAIAALSATAGTRVVQLVISVPTGVTYAIYQAPKGQTASTTCLYTWGPHLTSFADSSLAADWVQVTAIPDVIWPAGTRFDVKLIGVVSTDTLGQTSSVLVEEYTSRATEVEADDAARQQDVPAPVDLA